MDQVPVEAISAIHCDVIARVLDRFEPLSDTVLSDAANFFPFIATTNKRASLPARGHRQKRDALR
jgi:hypothetical protein